jgi:tetratricopeptide (TPR) repeat protein
MRPKKTWRLAAALALAATIPACAGNAAGPNLDAESDFGVEMARRGLWSEALFRFKQAEKARPNDAKVLNNVAVAYEAVGQFELALEAYQRALRANPSNRELKQNYSSFIEFYQGFKPEGKNEVEGQQPETSAPNPPDQSSGRRR